MHKQAVVIAIVLVALVSTNCSDPPLPAATPTPETFGEWLEGEELEWYTRIPSSARRDVEFYYSVLGYDQTFEWLTVKVRKLDNGAYTTAWLPELTVPLPTPEESLTAEELAKIESLDGRLYETFMRDWNMGVGIYAPDVEPLDREMFVGGLIDAQFRRLREGLGDTPAAIPPVAELLNADGLEIYEALDAFWQERFWEQVADRYLTGQAQSGNIFPTFQDWETKNTFNQLALQYEQYIRP